MSTLITIVSFYVAKIPNFPSRSFFWSRFHDRIFLPLEDPKRILVDYLVGQGYNNFNVLVIGAGKVGHTLVQEIKRSRGWG